MPLNKETKLNGTLSNSCSNDWKFLTCIETTLSSMLNVETVFFFCEWFIYARKEKMCKHNF